MKIRELEVMNFRGFDGECRFLFSDRVTVIAGINGRGKTSVLDGLALLISRLFRSLGLSSGNQRTISAADVHAGRNDASLAMRVHCAGVPLVFSVAFRPDSRRVRASPIAPAVKREITHNYGDPNRADDQAPIAVYYTTDRAGLRLPRSLPTDLPSGQQLAHNGALSNRMVDYRDFMARYRVWQSQETGREIRAFESVLGNFLEGFSEVEVEDVPLRITVQKQGLRLALNQLSDGERSFIAMLGDMVRRLALANPDLADPLQGHGVVLIDELELHLHPKWQREILQRLHQTFPNVQFVATTHSPFVIQSLEAGELVNLDPDDGEYADRSLEDIAEDIMGVELPQKSVRFQQMYEVAREYYRALESAVHANDGDLLRLKNRLDELSMPFSRDPAYQAFLEFQRSRTLGEENA